MTTIVKFNNIKYKRNIKPPERQKCLCVWFEFLYINTVLNEILSKEKRYNDDFLHTTRRKQKVLRKKVKMF